MFALPVLPVLYCTLSPGLERESYVGHLLSDVFGTTLCDPLPHKEHVAAVEASKDLTISNARIIVDPNSGRLDMRKFTLKLRCVFGLEMINTL